MGILGRAHGREQDLPPRELMDFEAGTFGGPERQGLVRELEANESRYRSLFGMNPDPTFILDSDCLIVNGNSALETITGYSIHELLLHPFADLLVDADREHGLRHVRRALSGVSQVLEVAGNSREGREFSLSLSVFPLQDDGQVLGVYGIGRDVTVQKEAERALRESEERYRLLAEHVQDMISLHDLDGRFLYATPSSIRVLGVHPVELIGKSVYDLILTDDEAPFRDAHKDILSRQGKAPLAFRARRADGSIGWFETTARMTDADATGERRIVSVTRDISDRRALEQRLSQSEKLEAIGRLAGGIAHDFNNLLTVIGGQAELALSQLPASATDVAASLDEISEASDRAAALTAQLLTFGKRQMTRPAVLDVNAAVLGLLTLMRRLLREDIAIETDLETELWPIRLDPAQLEQVLLNLVVNARDAMAEGGTVRIATSNMTADGRPFDVPGLERVDYVVLRVSDSGVGMDEDTASRAFEPFFSSKGASGGTGLGLPTVYGIVEQAGGVVSLTSSPGAGTMVSIYLRRALDDTLGSSTNGASAGGKLHGTETVLLAEDDAGVRGLAQAVLQRYGYHVVAAASGQEALSLFDALRGRVDILVSDVMMPNMRGPELVEQLRARVPALPVLYISGYAADALARNGVAGDEIQVLSKPFRPDALAAVVRSILDRHAVSTVS